ncbi:MAG: cupredoxin domain-containing protein [Thermoplasmatota archaeon]
MRWLALLVLALPVAHAELTLTATDDGSGAGPGYHYDPIQPTASPGETIRVVDTGSEPHSVTAVDGSFDVTVRPGTNATFTAPASGVHRFYCKFHAGPMTPLGKGMVGILTVAGSGPRTPAVPAVVVAVGVLALARWRR